MTILISIAIIAALFGGITWFSRKAGADSVMASTNKEVVNEIVDANRPVSSDELNRVRSKYSRD